LANVDRGLGEDAAELKIMAATQTHFGTWIDLLTVAAPKKICGNANATMPLKLRAEARASRRVSRTGPALIKLWIPFAVTVREAERHRGHAKQARWACRCESMFASHP
jgi:hypothetical protein